MVASKGVSRATSVVSNGNARDVLKRRNKPYRTEQQKVIAKKRKLDIKVCPPFDSSIVGHDTDLSSRRLTVRMYRAGTRFSHWAHPILPSCVKKSQGSVDSLSTLSTSVLSQAQPSPIYDRNTTNTHEQANAAGNNAWDPEKLSHHVHRIGYHFLSEVVEEACATLGYHAYKNSFISTEELKQRQHDSIVSKAFAKHGLNYDCVKGNEETPEQVRAAIKEMFPKIPQHDLDEIVTRAWEAGSHRVGSATDVPLSRRAQLATLARIRHTYTDYDALLRAFGDWQGTRKQVEPFCVQKMIEWRGETDGDDEGLEEIIRETIVIDDDDDDDDAGGDSSDTGGASDTSMEISHRPAAVDDLRAEEANERDHRFFQRHQPLDRTLAERSDIARQKINAVRTGDYNRRAYAYNQPAEYRQPQPEIPQRIYIPSYDRAEPPQQVMSGDRIMRLVS